jgi:hypothetical protein
MPFGAQHQTLGINQERTLSPLEYLRQFLVLAPRGVTQA